MRGINVGGKNRLPMAELVTAFEKAGCTRVRTYIQSGNVVFSISSEALEGLAKAVTKIIEARLGIRTPVVIREASDLERVAIENPFLREVQDTGTLHVGFLQDDPDPSRVAKLDPNRSPGDRFKWLGREIYLHLPNGAARSKFTNAYFDSALATVSTFRNWRTVLTMLEMTREKA